MSDALPNEISAATLLARQERGERDVLLDVREQNEWNLFRIPGAVHLPLGRVSDGAPKALARSPDAEIVAYCARGARSSQAVEMLRALGYRATSLAGGIAAWVDAGGE
ncbi:MAG: rhodanese-like domain-containing protein, partial [Gemmatimonadaceae bacterium]|nr:rhodanese-like domain-containing protein [Gemmatimonadaceae bacterium]